MQVNKTVYNTQQHKKINGKQVNKNTTTNATRINVNNDVYIYRDFSRR